MIMLCEKILCNLKELADLEEKKIDYVDFEWDEAFKKIHKKTSRGGVEVGLRLEDSVLTQGIRTGDVFYMDEEKILAASILPCRVIEVHVRKDHPHMVAKVCYEIGNRHATLLWGEGENTFITPSELNTGTYTERADAQYIANMLSSDIKVIDTMEALLPHRDEDIYFLRDCHWQQLGAYYAAESLAKAAGVPFADLSTYEKYEEDCLGSVYVSTKYDGLMYEGETFTYYVPQNDYLTEYYNSSYEFQFDYPLIPRSDYNATSFYSLFMVADSYIKHITTNVGNGRVLVVVKDDYPSAMVPCLTSSFEEIYVIDARYCDFNLVDFCKEKGATDVFVGMTVESALSDFGTYLDYIMNL